MLKRCLVSGVVVAAGDVLCQSITNPTYDGLRTIRFAIVGTTLHAPYWFYGFRFIDKLPLGGQTLMSAFRRSIATQILLSPPYFILFYGWLGVLEGLTYQQILEEKQQPIMDTVQRGLIFWPIVNSINFRFMLPNHRLHYVTVAGVFWNAAVSYANVE